MSFALGTPCWMDFDSTDMATSKAFYAGLLGWEFEDGGADVAHYNLVRRDGELVCGGMDVTGMTCPDGAPLPSDWTIYFAVEDLDARCELVRRHGGRIIVDPNEAPGAGRFAIALDPSGAAFGMWQSTGIDGYVFREGAPGTPVWFELITTDYQKSVDFYSAVLDFDVVEMAGEAPASAADSATWRYGTNGSQDEASCGICQAPWMSAGDQPYWRVYFAVASSAEAQAKVVELGGEVLDGPEDSPYGKILTVREPAGATFQLAAVTEATPM